MNPFDAFSPAEMAAWCCPYRGFFDAFARGGKGAEIGGVLHRDAGTVLTILVGGPGIYADPVSESLYGGGGGGASFVALGLGFDSTPLVVAGGGGGGGPRGSDGRDGVADLLGTSGKDASVTAGGKAGHSGFGGRGGGYDFVDENIFDLTTSGAAAVVAAAFFGQARWAFVA